MSLFVTMMTKLKAWKFLHFGVNFCRNVLSVAKSQTWKSQETEFVFHSWVRVIKHKLGVRTCCWWKLNFTVITNLHFNRPSQLQFKSSKLLQNFVSYGTDVNSESWRHREQKALRQFQSFVGNLLLKVYIFGVASVSSPLVRWLLSFWAQKL